MADVISLSEKPQIDALLQGGLSPFSEYCFANLYLFRHRHAYRLNLYPMPHVSGITYDGELQPFKGGIMKIIERAQADGIQAPVVPMALTNLWGSYFSRIERGTAMVRPFRRGMFSRVGLNVGAPVAASDVQPEPLRGRVAQLLQA